MTTAPAGRSRILGLAPMVLFSVSAMITLDSVATVAAAWFYWVNLAYWAPAVFVIFAGTVRSAFWPEMSRTWEELIVIGLLWLVVAIGVLPRRLTTRVNNASAAAKMAVLLAAGLVGLALVARDGVASPVAAGELVSVSGIGLAAVAVIIWFDAWNNWDEPHVRRRP